MKFKRLLFLFLSFVIILGTVSFGIDTTDTKVEVKQDSLDIYSESAILIHSNTGLVLYSKNGDEKVYPASTTKVLTAILAIEKGNLSDTTTASYDAISVIPSGYSSAYLSEGEEMSVENLLKVLLVHSANDAANVLAEYISGSIDEFVGLMNQKASELGCKNTHFVNTNGIHNDNHYTTAHDLAIITKYCMKNKTFRDLVSLKTCTIPATNKSEERKYVNTNDLINPSSKYYYEDCIGGKTGFTSQAKNCLISVCSKDGLELISVVLGATQTEDGHSARYVDSATLFDYGYSTYSISNIATKSTVIDTIEINNANSKTKNLDLILEDDINALVKTNSKENINYEINLKEDLTAPISANSVVGTITYTVEGVSYTKNLLASKDVVKNNILIWVLRFFLIIIILVFVFIILFKKIKK